MSQYGSKLSRRTILAGAAALPLAAAATSTKAGAPMLGAASAPFNRITLGDFEVTTLLAATRTVKDPQNIFGTNVSLEEFAAASAEANIPTNKTQFFFTPTVVNTGAELILFDTGLSGAGVTSALVAAGYSADMIDTVVITHMHGDHIGGLMTNGAATFPNATYIAGEIEFDAWDMSGDENFENKMRPFAEQTTFIGGGDSVASGVTAIEAFGHTPGHMAFMLESGGKQLLLGADFANHYVWSLAHPDWEVLFDRDKAAAARTRRSILSMLANDKLPMIGYHMPWPGIGFVESRGDGFQYVPHSYQLTL